VYIEEIASGVRTIASVSTSVTAFVGRAKRGLINQPITCFSRGDFNRLFGGLWADRPLTYCVEDFFANGGTEMIMIRLFKPASENSTGIAAVMTGTLNLEAASPGEWGNKLATELTHPEDLTMAAEFANQMVSQGIPIAADDLFDLTVIDNGTGSIEVHRNLVVNVDGGPRRVDRVLETSSNLVRLRVIDGEPDLPPGRPFDGSVGGGVNGSDGESLLAEDYIGLEDAKTGFHALLKADIFNLLCIPPDARGGMVDTSVWEAAAEFCRKRRAFLIIDPPADWDANPDMAAQGVKDEQQNSPLITLTNAAHAALYFPRLRKRDPLRDYQMDSFVPSGAIAGIMARIDSNRGVWKAPAGTEATISGADELTVKLTDEENGILNPIGVNCLRTFRGLGRVVWGARTLRGSDQLSDDYKYIPVRRLALFIEESLFRGTQWVVFEPNDEPLWAQIRMNVGAFMQRLFRRGAFQGSNPREAYFVKCDSETTTQDDINRGIVNIVVGFAPLQPAEFVIIQIQQIRNAS
jgi:phage tail sheath protein FI